jgi:hypothetical protein
MRWSNWPCLLLLRDSARILKPVWLPTINAGLRGCECRFNSDGNPKSYWIDQTSERNLLRFQEIAGFGREGRLFAGLGQFRAEKVLNRQVSHHVFA